MEEFLIFTGAVIMAVPGLLRRRWREFFYYFDLCGTQSLLIVLLICFLMGVVLGIQGAIQMSKVGTEIFMVDLIGFSVLKELGPRVAHQTLGIVNHLRSKSTISSASLNELIPKERSIAPSPVIS